MNRAQKMGNWIEENYDNLKFAAKSIIAPIIALGVVIACLATTLIGEQDVVIDLLVLFSLIVVVGGGAIFILATIGAITFVTLHTTKPELTQRIQASFYTTVSSSRLWHWLFDETM